jgi:predicted secreted Zn-dependent protease
MKKYLFYFLFLFLIFGSTSLAESEIPVTESNTYYDIHGNTLEQLMSEMHHKGGRTFGAAWTDWRVYWMADRAQTPQGFVVTKSNTKLTITYLYPRWGDESKAPAELRKKWDAYCKAVIIHEKGHGAIAMEAAREVDKAVMAVKPEKYAQSLEGRVSVAGNKVLKKYIEKEAEYDKVTKFGQKQGATF